MSNMLGIFTYALVLFLQEHLAALVHPVHLVAQEHQVNRQYFNFLINLN
jgi:hypothetical protein